ncbi:immunoglobulin superfamily member [Megalops cyprinoides]|uniref:immunoglobulin superfamily member n=1 Tax=Megalops cyprinoides TaxID=118141 RepID=UPI001864C715|nr:immunoglobulin superfamily member [Megalops cyprinoides]
MGPFSPSRPARALPYLLLATVIGGLISLSVVCDGATLSGLTADVNTTADPLASAPETNGTEVIQSAPEMNSTDAAPAASEEEEGPGVEQHPPKEKAVEGEDVVFSCTLKHGHPSGVVVQWIHERLESEHTVLEGNQTGEDMFADRAFLSGDLAGGDYSMTLRNVSAVDRGIYLCVLTLPDGSILKGSGTKLSIRKNLSLQGLEESVGTIVGVAVAAVGVVGGLIALALTQFREKLNCLQK